MKSTIDPQLTLVGAGPGDPDLITVKGIKAIADADVILYDDLACKDLLQYSKSKTEHIYVGKRVGKHSHTQDTINELIVHFAKEKGHVVRLKGGDPFIFGRGYEEIHYAQAHNVTCQMVPGISSAHAVPALRGIPLTSRGISQSYWVVTATSQTNELTDDISLAAQSSATIVVLMGTRKLRAICEIFQLLNKGETPVAIIQNGSLKNEKFVRGTINSIEQLAEGAQVSSPAVIVIGETVALSEKARLADLASNYIIN
ncbi:uroporphyrinogen-III C-methyltransferase [Roseivirga misakiensis]|uniref:uroporphyrinogen-III C-methyltransferase n=1 Tax=Roseivirga misakiensis TaxID=1563681 RepID=A0A1E5SK69_9BACT|nr:uroporphyrinogen-III C-methyltransferase [Roseivirga misakiensis]OEJ99517.1 uroporphyrinogen-III C-methyltransferase [Roseivirga misakiensis]